MDKKFKQTVKLCETAAAAELIKHELPVIAETTKLIATLRKVSYDAHIAAGFTEEQALVLCRHLSAGEGGEE